MPKTAKAKDGEQCDSDREDAEPAQDWDDSVSEASSDVVTLCSDVDEEVQHEFEDLVSSDVDSSGDGDALPKAKMGTHTIFNNGYFTLSSDKTCWPNTSTRKYIDCKIQVLKQWQKSADLGSSNASKNAPFKDFGDGDPNNPVRSYPVARGKIPPPC